jgi:propionyl-CoA carboxylase alpha chain
MNTRLQVEHPVTEAITGLDLVEQMIRVAAGEKLGFKQKDLKIGGWAIESRIYAEDPYRNFLPSIGRLRTYRPPAEGRDGAILVRNDAGVREGDEISMFYDPMIAKLVTHGPDRLAAIDAQARALDGFVIEGIQDNIPFLGAVMEEKRFRSGDFTTAYIKEQFPDGFQGAAPSEAQTTLLAACAAFAHAFMAARAARVSGRLNGIGAAGRRDWIVIMGGRQHACALDWRDDGADITVDDAGHRLQTAWRPGAKVMEGRFDGEAFSVKLFERSEGYVLRLRGVAQRAIVASPRGAALHERLPEKPKADTSKLVMSPMPGLVVSVDVVVGQDVKEGEGVAIVEAMKMQNIIRAERDGTVAKVNVAAGASVMADEVLVELA